jgi:hypothetical protein
VLLLVAEEHVAMIDLALDGNDIDGADTAFAALARIRRPAGLSSATE